MKQLLFLILFVIPSFAQLPNIDYVGMMFGTVQVTPSVSIRKVSSLPATCTAVGSASSSNAVLYQGRVYQCTATDTWTATVTTSTGASLALDNLVSVAINTHLLPGSVNAVDLGSTSKWFRDAYLGTSGSFYSKFTTTPTANRTITFPDATITVAGSASALTSGRVPYVTTGGLLLDSANFTFSGSALTVSDSITASGSSSVSYYIPPNKALRMNGSPVSTDTFYLDVPRVAYRDPSNGYNAALYLQNKHFILGYDGVMKWDSTGDATAGTIDTGFGRNAAGKLEVNNGTLGTLRDLKLRDLYFPALAFSTTAPTVTSAGSSPSITVSNGTASFRVNIGTGGTAHTLILAMPAATTGWNCAVNNITAAAANRADWVLRQTASTTTSVTIQMQTVSTGAALAFAANDIVSCNCVAH